LTTLQIKILSDWSPNGRFLLYPSIDLKTGSDLWALPLDGTRKPTAVVQTSFEEREGQFSPDGKCVSPDGQRFLRIKEGGGTDQTAAPPQVIVVQHWSRN
jgi:Tol biopolymer transport system component